MYACLFVCKKSVCIWRHYKCIRLCICTDNGKAKNVVYSQVLRSSKHIYKFIYIHRWYTGTQLQWRVTTYVRGGGLEGTKRAYQLGVGVARSATPTASSNCLRMALGTQGPFNWDNKLFKNSQTVYPKLQSAEEGATRLYM